MVVGCSVVYLGGLVVYHHVDPVGILNGWMIQRDGQMDVPFS